MLVDFNIYLNTDIYHKSFIQVRFFILENSGTFTDVEDVLQEGLKIFFENLQKENFYLSTTPENYIYQVCKKLWYKELRRRNIIKHTETDISVDSCFQREELDSVVRRDKLFCILEKAIEKLPPRGRQFYTLKLDGYNLSEIAEKMGLKSYQLAKDKSYRLKKRLIEIIKQDPEYQKLFYHEQETRIIGKILCK